MIIRSACIVFLSVVLVGFALAGTPAYAAPDQVSVTSIDNEIQQCSQIKGRIKRLTCYDEIAKKLGYKSPDAQSREAEILDNYGFWEVTKRRNAAGEEIIYLRNDSVEAITSKSGMKRHPTLTITCKHGTTNIYLDWKVGLQSRARVDGFSRHDLSYQFGADARRVVTWDLSTDRQALFAPNPVAFIKEMRDHDRIIFYLTPHYDIAQTIVHDISGLNTVLQILVDECYN